MRRMMTVSALALHLWLATAAAAQTFENLTIDVEGRTIGVTGGEKPNVGFSTGPIVIGKPRRDTIAKVPNMCGFTVGSGIPSGTISAWSVEVTPIRVEGEAVTFRLGWSRSRDNGTESSSPSGDQEITLRPGQSLPLDIVPLSPAVTMPYQQCQVRATSLRVAVNYWPRPDVDRRLLATDLWLIERAADGSETSRALSVRGPFNRATPFYFDTISDGGISVEFFGEFTVSNAGDAMLIKLETRSRLVQGAETTTTIREGALYSTRMVDATIRLKPNDVASVELPKLGANSVGAFANRTFSIRVRSRQVR